MPRIKLCPVRDILGSYYVSGTLLHAWHIEALLNPYHSPKVDTTFFILQRGQVRHEKSSPGYRANKCFDQESNIGWWTSEPTFIMISLLQTFICA